MSPEIRTELDPTPASAAQARRFVREVLDAWDCDDPDEVALLLTSEVVSNAVRHAATELVLRVALDDQLGTLRVEVLDGAQGEPTLQPRDDGATGGRGLLLVDALAERWGTEPAPPGKVVWFELGAHPRRRD